MNEDFSCQMDYMPFSEEDNPYPPLEFDDILPSNMRCIDPYYNLKHSKGGSKNEK